MNFDVVEAYNNLKREAGDEGDAALLALADYISASMSNSPNLQLPSPGLRDFYRDEHNRIIWLMGDVANETLDIIKQIFEYNRIDKDIPVEQRTPIKLIIDTNGGDVGVMYSLVQAIKISKTPIYTVNFCKALSAGAHILAAGHKRFAMPGSTVLIHSGSCAYNGTVEQIESAKKYFDGLNKKADEQLMTDTKITADMLKKKAASDWYLTAEEAKRKGVVDTIISDFSEIM